MLPPLGIPLSSDLLTPGHHLASQVQDPICTAPGRQPVSNRFTTGWPRSPQVHPRRLSKRTTTTVTMRTKMPVSKSQRCWLTSIFATETTCTSGRYRCPLKDRFLLLLPLLPERRSLWPGLVWARWEPRQTRETRTRNLVWLCLTRRMWGCSRYELDIPILPRAHLRKTGNLQFYLFI